MIHLAGSDCRLILKFWDERTLCVKIVITTGRDCGRPASWIKKINQSKEGRSFPCTWELQIVLAFATRFKGPQKWPRRGLAKQQGYAID